MGGPRLTPEQVETAAEVFGRTGNTSEAARAIGVPESTLRTWFEKNRTAMRTARNRELHTRACETGLRKARKYLTTGLAVVDKMLRDNAFLGETEGGGAVPVSLEPEQLARLVGSLGQAATAMVKLSEAGDTRRQARLSRAKSRADIRKVNAEIAALEREGAPTMEKLLTMLSQMPEGDVRRAIEALRARGQGDAPPPATT